MIRQHLKSLARDESGASIIEMAMVLPVLSGLLIGMIDISRAYAAKLSLEQAAYRAIEKVQQYNTTASTYSTLKSEAAAAANASGFSGVTDSDVTIDYWLECNGTRKSDYNTSCAGTRPSPAGSRSTSTPSSTRCSRRANGRVRIRTVASPCTAGPD